MKRKLAFLLAAVMTATMLPMNLFAKSSNALEKTIAAVEDNTVIIQRGFTVSGGSFTTGYAKDTGGNDDVEGYMVGSDFVIEVDSTITTGDSIDLRLDNATWMYQTRSASPVTATIGLSDIDSDIQTAFGITTVTPRVETGRINDGGSVNYTSDGSVYATIDEDLGYMGTPGSGPAYDSVYYSVTSGGSVVDYVMGFSGVDDSLATIKFNRILNENYKIRIPMAILVPDSEKEVSLTISGSNTAVNTGKYIILSAVAGGSVMTTSSVKTFRTAGNLGTISVKELKLGSLKTNAGKGFTITLADGYEFVSSSSYATTVSSLELTAPSFIGGYTDDDEYTVTVNGTGVSHTSNLATIYIEGLRVKAPKTISNEEINLTIEDLGGSNDMGVTTETVKVGKYADFGASIAKTNSGDKIPALVAGREPKNSGDDNKLVKFKLSETVAGTIATGRDTKLIFPEDIKVLGVTVKPSASADWATPFAPVADYDGDNLNEVTITNLSTIKATKKVALEFEAWVSIPASFAGNDITVTAVNAGIPAEVEPLVVATTIAPVSVETTVSTIKVGSQAQAVSNIKIIENVAGALQKNKEVLITITDAYGSATNNNLVIATGAKRTVTDGDIDVSLSSTTTTVSAAALIGTNGNTLKLTVDRASRKPSTIELSNLFVRANNDLPQTNGVPYKVYVYGTAVAGNYGSKSTFTTTFASGETKGNYDQLVNSGYFANFLEVAGTQVGGTATIPSKEFVLVAGATSALVDGNAVEFTADMATYLDPAGTVMLSTRLISEAFGLVPLWDDATRTVTIVDLAGNPIVMFPVGKTYYVKNGMNVPMVNNGVVATTVVKDGRTFVSLRQIANALGFGDKVQWDDSTKTVTLNKKATN